MAIFWILGLTASAESPLDERMENHWRLASALETEVVHGNLDVVRATATQLSAFPTDSFGVELEEPLEFLRMEAATLAHATTLKDAAIGVSRVAAACGACHSQLSAGPPVRLKSWTPVGAEEDAAMAPHQEAVDWMWLGIIAPSDDAWRRGTKSLAKVAPDVNVQQAVEKANRAARAERPAAYAELLQACAGCHTSTAADPHAGHGK